MAIVSLYSNIKDSKNGKEIDLYEIMQGIRTGEWQKNIDRLRQKVRENASKEEQEKEKSKLPYFTASGLFSQRKVEGLIKHTGKMAIDLDAGDNPQLVERHEEIKKELSEDKYTEFLFTTCRGQGLCIIVNIDKSKHLDSFLFLEKYYKNNYGLTIDKSCKDITRARYVSADTGLFHNPEYEVVYLENEFDHHQMTTVEDDGEKYDWCVKVIKDKNEYHYVPGQRHNYLVVLAYFLNKVGVSSSYAESRMHSDFEGDGMESSEIKSIHKAAYNKPEAIAKHGTFVINKKISELPAEVQGNLKAVYAYAHKANQSGRRVDEKDVQHVCTLHLVPEHVVKHIFEKVFKDNAHKFDLDNKPEVEQVEIFLAERWEIIRNVVTGICEYRPAKSNKLYTPHNVDTIFRELQHAGFRYPLDKLKSLIKSDYVPDFNPFEDYFNNLPEYDPKEEIDYIDLLSSHVKTDNDEFWRVQFKKALVRCIACSVGLKENRIIITLVEKKQNTGKTNFLRFLNPPKLAAYYTESSLNDKKDSNIQLSENFIWNLEELSSLSMIDVNKLKAIVSTSSVKERRAYGSTYDKNPRRVNFWASTNKPEFLADESNTRWLCFNVKSIDHDYNNFKTKKCNVNIDNVWAQAWHLYKTGFDYQLSVEEAQYRDKSNRLFELSSVEKDLLLKSFTQSKVPGQGDFMTQTDILIKLQELTDNKIKLNSYAIQRALSQLEYEQTFRKIEGKTVRGYWLQMRTQLGSTGSIYDPLSEQGDLPLGPEKKKKPF